MLDEIKKTVSAPIANLTKSDVANLEIEDLLTNELTDWFCDVGETTLEIPWSAELLRIYCAGEIRARQKGYFAQRGKQNNQWNPEWLVIGDAISDPIIFDRSVSPGRVLIARHGEGGWNPRILAPSLTAFKEALEVWCKLFVEKYEKDIYESDFAIREIFIEELRMELSSILPRESTEAFIESVE